MTRFEAPPAVRRRGLAATAVALVAALLVAGSPLSASADELPTTGTITGSVTTPDGQPVEGASIFKAFSGQSTTTDAAGEFALSDLEFGSFEVSVYKSGFLYTPSQQGALTAEAPNAQLSFVLTPYPAGAGTISGLITVDGVPLAGKDISAYEQTTGQNVYAVSDENGHYELTALANGAWRVVSYNPQYQPLFTDPVTITDSAQSATVNVPLLSWPVGTASITGTLANGQTGSPISGVSVSLQGIGVAHQSSVITDENGAFAFASLPAGSFSLSAYSFGYIGGGRQVDLADGEAVVAGLSLVPTNSTISGTVTGPNGAPIAGIFVEAASAAGNSIGSAQTGADGSYVIPNLGAVEYRVSVGGASAYVAQERYVTAIADGDVTANFTLKARKTGSISGWVLLPSGDYYSQPVCVTLYGSKNKKPLDSYVNVGEQFGDGGWGFSDLKPGKYTVEVRDCDDDRSTRFKPVFLGGAKNYKGATFVTVVAGVDSYENNITITPKGH